MIIFKKRTIKITLVKTVTHTKLRKKITYFTKASLWKIKFPYKSWYYITKIKIHCFNFIWILSLEVLPVALSTSIGAISSFSLGASPTSMVTEAKACSKLWEAVPSFGTSVALFDDISLGVSGSFVYSYWFGGRVSWGCISLIGLATVEATSPCVEGRFEAWMANGW